MYTLCFIPYHEKKEGTRREAERGEKKQERKGRKKKEGREGGRQIQRQRECVLDAACLKVVRKERQREEGRERGKVNMGGGRCSSKAYPIDLHLPTHPHVLSLHNPPAAKQAV